MFNPVRTPSLLLLATLSHLSWARSLSQVGHHQLELQRSVSLQPVDFTTPHARPTDFPPLQAFQSSQIRVNIRRKRSPSPVLPLVSGLFGDANKVTHGDDDRHGFLDLDVPLSGVNRIAVTLGDNAQASGHTVGGILYNGGIAGQNVLSETGRWVTTGGNVAQGLNHDVGNTGGWMGAITVKTVDNLGDNTVKLSHTAGNTFETVGDSGQFFFTGARQGVDDTEDNLQEMGNSSQDFTLRLGEDAISIMPDSDPQKTKNGSTKVKNKVKNVRTQQQQAKQQQTRKEQEHIVPNKALLQLLTTFLALKQSRT